MNFMTNTLPKNMNKQNENRTSSTNKNANSQRWEEILKNENGMKEANTETMQLLLPITSVRIFGDIRIIRALLVVQCAWCKKDIQLSWTPGDAGISHGLCQDCKEKMETL